LQVPLTTVRIYASQRLNAKASNTHHKDDVRYGRVASKLASLLKDSRASAWFPSCEHCGNHPLASRKLQMSLFRRSYGIVAACLEYSRLRQQQPQRHISFFHISAGKKLEMLSMSSPVLYPQGSIEAPPHTVSPQWSSFTCSYGTGLDNMYSSAKRRPWSVPS